MACSTTPEALVGVALAFAFASFAESIQISSFGLGQRPWTLWSFLCRSGWRTGRDGQWYLFNI
jgi:hypothetical protein